MHTSMTLASNRLHTFLASIWATETARSAGMSAEHSMALQICCTDEMTLAWKSDEDLRHFSLPAHLPCRAAPLETGQPLIGCLSV